MDKRTCHGPDQPVLALWAGTKAGVSHSSAAQRALLPFKAACVRSLYAHPDVQIHGAGAGETEPPLFG